ncbi:MAG TPA: hypothetical protein VGL48_14885 [Acidimicrobiales bacterium]|jgi:hypothetical protein
MTDITSMFTWCRATAGTSRPHYLWSVLAAAKLARSLGIERMSAIEFGVAGGNGLLALESVAELVESLLGVGIDVFGFDSGTGMPEPQDLRDAPFVIQGGNFPMDVHALETRLSRGRLVLGPVETTAREWLAEEHPPVGFVAFDLDYYTSTMHAFHLLDGDSGRILPRVVCYFDDIFGLGWSDFNGERAAIAEFNEIHTHRKVGPVHGLKYGLPRTEFELSWPEKIYLAHIFEHDRYSEYEGPLSARWYDELRLSPGSRPSRLHPAIR